MAISSVSAAVNTAPPSAPAQPAADNKAAPSDNPAPATPAAPAPTVLTTGASGAHHKKVKHHAPQAGQPGFKVDKKA